MNLDEIKETFFIECADQMVELETGLNTLVTDGVDIETVNSVFRAVHSVKGGAGAFELTNLVNFAHVFENALDIIRVDLGEATDSRLNLLLRAADVLNDIVVATRDEGEPIECAEITTELAQAFDISEVEEDDPDDAINNFQAVPISIMDLDLGDGGDEDASGDFDLGGGDGAPGFHVSFEPKPGLYLNGHDPQKLFRELAELGSLTATCDVDKMPVLSAMNPDDNYLSWSLVVDTDGELDSNTGEGKITEIFDWVSTECELSISYHAAEGGADGPSDNFDDFIGDDLMDIGEEGEVEGEEAPAEADLDAPLEGAAAPEETPAEETPEAPMAEETPETPIAEAPTAEVVELKPAEAEETKAAPKKVVKKTAQSIRVDSERVDRLINLMGELVINEAMLAERITNTGVALGSEVGVAMAELQSLTREIQNGVMAIRAQPVKPVFMRMSRVVREVCSATGKKAVLEFDGENTEVDTTVIEGLSDPLTHMIRNAVDHGIESPEVRLAAGKPAQGVVKLVAMHASGRIVIEIRDDGAGINRERVLEMALKKGIVSPEANLTDNEIDNLIFAAGFSTAETITDVSGRGVGMDVVRQSVQSLGGRVSITSTPGHGSVFSMSLPLTLAILDGMIVKEADQTLVIPVSSVLETLSLQEGDVTTLGNEDKVMQLRDKLIPIVDVGYELGFAKKRETFTGGTVLVVEGEKDCVGAFVVDSIMEQQQVVIKSLESNYQRISGIAAATILGNGRIALILDAADILSLHDTDANNNLAKTG
ncbi:MAG: chemotaxis protein CheA [Hyphomicrobiales bacterium]|nr:MAG: chemotaxis protein CheA [Hyphomicrobiales bacterium]